jgi:hypothetical protein
MGPPLLQVSKFAPPSYTALLASRISPPSNAGSDRERNRELGMPCLLLSALAVPLLLLSFFRVPSWLATEYLRSCCRRLGCNPTHPPCLLCMGPKHLACMALTLPPWACLPARRKLFTAAESLQLSSQCGVE